MDPEMNGLPGLLQAIRLTYELLRRRGEKAELLDELFNGYGDRANRKLAKLHASAETDFINTYASRLAERILELLAREAYEEAEIAAFDAIDELGAQVKCLAGDEDTEAYTQTDTAVAPEAHSGEPYTEAELQPASSVELPMAA